MSKVEIKDLRGIKDSSADFEVSIKEYKNSADVLLFKFHNENELSLIGYKEDVGPEVLSIPSEVKGFPVTRIEDNVFQYGCMDKVVLPNTIKYIGNKSFYYCFCLKEVVLPDSVIEIGHFAFSGCHYLKKVEIPRTVSIVGKGVLSDCYFLSSIIVDPRNENYDSRENCNAIIHSVDGKLIAVCKNTVIPQSVKIIEGAFCAEWFLKEYVVPEHIVEIGCDAFSYCENLERIIIPNSVKRIGKCAFYGCTKLQDIEFLGSIEEIEENAFAFCENMKHINLPLGLQTIAPHAFENCKLLKEVVIPESVLAIGNCAFYGTNLEDLFVPKSVVALGSNDNEEQFYGVFEGDNLLSIKVSPENKVYDSRNNCNAIVETASNSIIQACNYTVIPDTVSCIAQYSFRDCKGVNSLVIPNSVTTIEKNAFDGCYGLQELYIPASVVEIAPLAFKECSPFSIVVSPENVVYDSRDNCNAIIETATNRLLLANNKPALPNTITEIADGALYYEELKSIRIPDSVQFIDQEVFQDCFSLRQIIIRDPSILEKCTINRDIIDVLSTEAAGFGANEPTESLEKAIIRFENDLNIDADSTQNTKLLFSQKVIEAIRKNDNYDYKREHSNFFNKLYVAFRNEVDSTNPEKSIKRVIFDILKHNYNYFSSLMFIKYLNIYNIAEKSDSECVEFYADFIHSLNGKTKLSKGKKLFSPNREDIDHGEIDATASITESLFHAGDALSNVFEYCHSCTSPIFSKMCYAIKCGANKTKYVYDDSLWNILQKEPKSIRTYLGPEEKDFNNWLDSLGNCYDQCNGVTNTICMIGCPWGNFSTDNSFEKYVLRANLGIDLADFSEKKEEIIVFLNQLQSFLTQISSEIINKIKDRNQRQTAVVASITQAMIRNTSHNWSHVTNNYTSDSAYERFSDEYIKQSLHCYHPLFDDDSVFPKEKNLQLSFFTQYQNNRQNYLSEITFEAPSALTTRRFYGDVMKELDRERVLLNHISGISKFSFEFAMKCNGEEMNDTNDLSVALPEVLGSQAIFNIVENIVRNTAKHSSHGSERIRFTLECKDVPEAPGYYCLEIDNGVVEDNIELLVRKQNDILNESVLDENYKLRTHGLGLLEMTVAAAFLRQIEISKINSYEYRFEQGDLYRNKYGNLIILKAINKKGALGYRLFLQKPKEFLFVGSFDVKDSFQDLMAKDGIQFISENEFAAAMEKGEAFPHPFLFYLDTVSNEIKELCDLSDCKTLLPVRKIEVCPEEVKGIFDEKKAGTNVGMLAQLRDFAWTKYYKEKILADLKNPDNENLKICTAFDPLKGNKAFTSNQVVFLDHANKKTHAKLWERVSNADQFEAWIENLSSIASTKLPCFNKFSVGTVSPVSDYVENIMSEDSIKYEIFEAYHNKVIVLDERIQRFSWENCEGSSKDSGPIPCSELFKSTNVLIPDVPLDPNAFDAKAIEKIEHFVNDNMPNAFMVVHYGILERIYKDETEIQIKLNEWAGIAQRVVVTSGRGAHSLPLPPSVCYANLSAVLYAFTENRNKFIINNILNQSRRKNG